MPSAGAFSGGARVHGVSAARRRDRRPRQWLRHERLSIRMCVAEMRHHAAPQPIYVHVGTQTAAPVIEHVASALANNFVASAPVIEYVASVSEKTLLEPRVPVVDVLQVPQEVIETVEVTFDPQIMETPETVDPEPEIERLVLTLAITYTAAPGIEYVTCSTPAPETDYETHSHVMKYFAPAPSASHVTPSEQFSPLPQETVEVVPGSMTVLELSASHVVGTLLMDEFATPVHQEQIASSSNPRADSGRCHGDP